MPPKVEKAKKSATKAAPKAEKKVKAKRGPAAPSAYIIFCKDKRADIQAKNPTATFGELGKLLGAAWGNLSDAEKAVSIILLIVNINIFIFIYLIINLIL